METKSNQTCQKVSGGKAGNDEQVTPKAEKSKGKIKAIVTTVSFFAALLTCIYILWWLWTQFSA